MNWENANFIIPYLWLGNMGAARDRAFMRDNDIRLVINCSKDIKTPEWYADDGIETIRLPIHDWNGKVENATLSNEIDSIIKKIHEYRKTNRNVFVHCFAGMQRSSTVIAAYVIRYYKFRPEHAIYYIRHKRRIAFQPRPTFNRFIQEFA